MEKLVEMSENFICTKPLSEFHLLDETEPIWRSVECEVLFKHLFDGFNVCWLHFLRGALSKMIYNNLKQVMDQNRFKPSASFQTALLDIQF
jgi:hypothetical protein